MGQRLDELKPAEGDARGARGAGEEQAAAAEALGVARSEAERLRELPANGVADRGEGSRGERHGRGRRGAREGKDRRTTWRRSSAISSARSAEAPRRGRTGKTSSRPRRSIRIERGLRRAGPRALKSHSLWCRPREVAGLSERIVVNCRMNGAGASRSRVRRARRARASSAREPLAKPAEARGATLAAVELTTLAFRLGRRLAWKMRSTSPAR